MMMDLWILSRRIDRYVPHTVPVAAIHFNPHADRAPVVAVREKPDPARPNGRIQFPLRPQVRVRVAFNHLQHYKNMTDIRKMQRYKILMLFFWFLAPCRLVRRCQRFGKKRTVSIFGAEVAMLGSPEVGDSMFLRNAGIYLRVYMAKTQMNNIIIPTAVKTSNLT
jgi:hypothetical protein